MAENLTPDGAQLKGQSDAQQNKLPDNTQTWNPPLSDAYKSGYDTTKKGS